jgi:GNAT superfamily N-acetyltransferase
MDRHDVELEPHAFVDDRGSETLRHDVAARTLEDQREWRTDMRGPVRQLLPLDPDQAQRAVPALETEQFVDMRSEILMVQDVNQGVAPPAYSAAATLNREATLGEVPLLDGTIILRPEQAGDAEFLGTLFRSSASIDLMPVDDAVRESLLQMQFASQAASYRSHYPHARFDIIERHGRPIGRLVVDSGGVVGCVVDFALLPECRGQGLGSRIMAAVVQQFARLRRPVRCMVLAGNETSLRLCRRAGFLPIDSTPPFVQLEWRPSDADT